MVFGMPINGISIAKTPVSDLLFSKLIGVPWAFNKYDPYAKERE